MNDLQKQQQQQRRWDDAPPVSNATNNNNNKRALLLTTSPSSLSVGTNFDDDLLPTNVCTEEQLKLLPSECLSDVDPVNRPLRHVHEDGITVTTYSLKPIQYSVLFILIVEVLERFSFYSINYTQTSYLTGQYDALWNAQMDSITASSYVSISVAVAYTAPFIGAMLGDKILGEYYTILFGCLVLYWPGLVLVAVTTIPHFLHMKQFNHTMLQLGLLVMWPVGSGIVKSVVNIFGAKQFHPLLQSALIETYYVNFYMCINIGALAGGIIVPLVASQTNITLAYFLPVVMLFTGICVFISGTPRYVQTNQPKGGAIANIWSMIQQKIPNNNSGVKIVPKQQKITPYKLFRVFVLIVPFCIAYSQMPTTFIIQGTVMGKACGGYIDAVLMYNNDTLSVLVFGYIIGTYIYPELAARKIKIPTTYKFAIGSMFAFVAIVWALVVDYKIHATYTATGGTVSVLWQAPSYILIGIGEIFAISAAYEVAFVAAPPETKVLSSALNIFCVGGIPNVICIGLFQLCQSWFTNQSDGTTNISTLDDYASAHVYKYFIVLLVLSSSGVIINVLPSVKEYVESIEEASIDLIKTPKTPKTPMLFRQESSSGAASTDVERASLLKQQRHDYYIKYGTTPSLYHANSMHAGIGSSSKTINNVDGTPSTGTSTDRATNNIGTSKKPKQIKKAIISKLYHQTIDNTNSIKNEKTTSTSTTNTVVTDQYVSLNGRPVSEWKPVTGPK